MDTPFPAYKGDESYVFVCYAHEDAESVYSEIARLRTEKEWDEAIDRIEDYLEQFPVSRHDENVRFV